MKINEELKKMETMLSICVKYKNELQAKIDNIKSFDSLDEYEQKLILLEYHTMCNFIEILSYRIREK